MLELADAKYPKKFNGHLITPTVGLSLVPVLKGTTRSGHDYLYFEHIGRKAVIHGDWKLLAPNNKPWELYNIRSDRTEVHNVAAQHPEIVELLAEKWQTWAKTSNVIPKPSKK